MPIHPAFIGHGTFTEDPGDLLSRYNGWTPNPSIPHQVQPSPPGTASAPQPDGVIRALQFMNIKSVWIYCFNRSGLVDQKLTESLIEALRPKFNLAAWGYCSSKNVTDALASAKVIKETYKIDAFIADVEPYNTGDDNWENQDSEFDRLINGLVTTFGTPNLGMSVAPPYLMLDSEQDKKSLMIKHLVQRAAPNISVLAPQVYWMDYPTNFFYDNTGLSPNDFPAHDPEAYAGLCIRCWRDAGVTLPIVITGQAYWSKKETSPARNVMEAKVASFTSTFKKWTGQNFADRNVIGMNWYHGGQPDAKGEGSMSDAMIKTIAAAGLDQRPYAPPP
jgi:hypothetical protein